MSLFINYLVSATHSGANVFARELAGRTPRELAVKVRDDTIQTQELMKDGISVSRISDASRGDFDLIIRLLEDVESKTVDIHKSAAEESRSIVQRGNVFKPLKTLQSTALGNALTGIHRHTNNRLLKF